MPGVLRREIAGPAGPLEALLDEPWAEPRAACVLAHPHPQYGGSMQTRAVYQVAKSLVGIGVACLRFNFRGVGRSRGVPGGGPGELRDYAAALDYVAAKFPDVRLWAGGVSFGSWVAWNVGLEDRRVTLLLGIGLPVNRFDFSPVNKTTKAKFLIHGERDDLVTVRDIRKFYSGLREPRELAVIDGADHLFDGKTLELGETVDDLLRDWDV
jgi:uncharacterized protein